MRLDDEELDLPPRLTFKTAKKCKDCPGCDLLNMRPGGALACGICGHLTCFSAPGRGK